MPPAELDRLVGYAVAFAAVAAAQAIAVSLLAFGALGLDTAGPAPVAVALAVGNAILGMTLGLFVSAFAISEFQAMQFIPAVVFPQLLLCGLFVAREGMAAGLRAASNVLPLTHAFDAIDRVTGDGRVGTRGAVDVGVIAGCTLLALALGAATLRRRTG
jgi:ABC-2 type transport system permease protein